jgi:hypothetical protein
MADWAAAFVIPLARPPEAIQGALRILPIRLKSFPTIASKSIEGRID